MQLSSPTWHVTSVTHLYLLPHSHVPSLSEGALGWSRLDEPSRENCQPVPALDAIDQPSCWEVGRASIH